MQNYNFFLIYANFRPFLLGNTRINSRRRHRPTISDSRPSISDIGRSVCVLLMSARAAESQSGVSKITNGASKF